MPTRKSGPRQPRQRIERPETATPAVPRTGASTASSASKTGRNPLFPVGASLYPLDAETQSADDWYARDLAEDIDALAEARCGLVKVYVSWRVLEPQVAQYSQEALDRLTSILDKVAARKMQAIVCLFADDRHAEMSDVTWGKRRDPRTDSYLLQREVALCAKVAGSLRGHKGVFAWLLGNEAFMSGFGSDIELESWTAALREAIREVDPERPIGLGCDAETLFRATGVDARAAIESCEFAVSHTTAAYSAYAASGPVTSGPSTYLDSFLLRAAHRGKPVLLDEVGLLSLDASVGEEAAHVRTVLWSALANRAGGALVRRLRDLDTERREPYFVDPFENLLGVADTQGVTKPAFDELRRFIRAAAAIDLRTHQLISERTAVLIPAERYMPLPSLAGLYDPRACLQAYVIAKRAQIPVAVAREADDLSDFQVVIVPSAFDLADETRERLHAFVQNGGTLLCAYGGGDMHPATRDLFGLEFLGDGGPRTTFSCRVAQPDALGDLESFDAVFETPNYALLTSVTSTVVATDAQGSPLLTMNQVGQGRAVFIAVPLERAIGQGDPWATPAPVSRMAREVYGAVARAAGCAGPVACSVPEVEVALFQGEADDIVLLINHAAEKVEAALATDRRVASIADVRGGAPVAVGGTAFGVPIDANGAVVLRLTYA